MRLSPSSWDSDAGRGHFFFGGMAKGRASLHSSDVANAFEKHYALTVDDPDELAVDAMTKKLEQEMRCASR